MNEIRILSRGGQGAVTAAKILVAAAMEEGKYAQAIPSFGQERKGAPVFTYARISETPILSHSYVYFPDVVVLFDTFLMDLGIDPLLGIHEKSTLVINTTDSKKLTLIAGEFAKTAYLDAWLITKEIIGDVPPNSAMLGAFAKMTGLVSISSISSGIKEFMPTKVASKNALCAELAYERTKIHE